ncbi:uncharacterized protein K02A2.6-like [Achroia grisella]|uniref:uncharacterized protein K02A2.6-like n=1 Tax=Achroia grisella TaxID=688607 RepID=UPI0027D27AF3|nr:uncharacterized protein K02A2.6-like [Achroia grisella]
MEHARPPSELVLEGGPAARSDAWRKWSKQFMVFMKASGVYKESTDVKSSLLVNLIGSDGYDIYTTFKYDKNENQEDFDILINKFNEHFGMKKNTTMARFKFFTRNQERGETIDEYVTALKLLTQSCEFEHLEEGLIRDRIVCGVTDSKLRDRLLREDDLDLGRAVKICQASEMTAEEQRQIENAKCGTEAGTSSAVDVVYGARTEQQWGASRYPRGGRQARRGRGRLGAPVADGAAAAARGCAACGSARCQGGSQCSAKSVKCFSCHEIGHFKRMCPGKRYKNKIYHIKESASDSDEELYYVSTLDGNSGNKNCKWYETLSLVSNNSKQVFKLDTGSDLNVMSINTFLNLGLNTSSLSPDKTKAQSFCGNYIPIIGSCYIDWIYKNRKYNLYFIISDQNCQSVLGKNACDELGLVRRIFAINIDDYDDLFQGVGKLPGKYSIITEIGAQPVVCPVRKIPLGVRDKLFLELERMEKLGVIRKVAHPTPWVNAIVVVAKKDGSIRLCLDPRSLNRVVHRAHYPLPTVTEIAAKLKGARFFSKLDARSGFWMIPILRLPYGINCASEVFHAKVRELLEDLVGVDSFVDDIIVWGSDKTQHDERLKMLLDRARQVGIKFNIAKCEFCVPQVTYLGHKFNSEGMHVDNNKLKAIKDMPKPQDRKSLERFLGMINYLSKFIPNYSQVAPPLRQLLKKDTVWQWDSIHDAAVQRLKELVCGAPVLALYSLTEPVVLSVDASSCALGAVLLQGGRPVEFASSTLTETQSRYAQIEKELLAIVYALERFHQYIFGRKNVVVETDHKPLEALFNKSLNSVPARLQRMMLRAQAYNFKVIYKPGKYMHIADALSRAPLSELMKDHISDEITEQSCFLIQNIRFSDSKIRAVRDATEKDDECKSIIRYIMRGWPSNKFDVDELVRSQWSYNESFEYIDGIIFKDNLVYIPRRLRTEMIQRVHDGHMGIDRCKRHARDVMFWPGMSRDVERAVRRCAACVERAHRPPREPLVPHNIPDLPWAKVGSDLFQCGKKYFLLLVDYFSNFIEVSPLTSINSKAVILAMKDHFSRHGIPQELVTDNGPAYASKEFKMFSESWDFDHTTTSPNYPQSNGRSERSVQIIKNILIKSMKSGTDFYLGLLNFRATPRDGIDAPSQLLMGRRLNTRLPSHICKLYPFRDNTNQYKTIISKQNNNKQYYDKHARDLPELRPGESVIMIDGYGNDRKRARVDARSSQPRSYFVSDDSGRRYRRNRRHLIQVAKTELGKSDNLEGDEERWSSAESEGDECYSYQKVDKNTANTEQDLVKNHLSNCKNQKRTPRQAVAVAKHEIKKNV